MMKRILSSLTITLAFTSLVICQSVQDVPATDGSGNPIINSLIKYVVADTNAQGQQMHDIYRLERGKYYFYNQSAVFNNPIVLEGASPGTDSTTFPAKFLVQPASDGSVPEEAVITTFANLTCKNLEFCTITSDNQYSWGNGIYIQKDGLRIELDSCYFDLCGWAFLEADYINHTSLIIRDCQTWNGSPFGGDEWVPFFLEATGGSVDTCIATNNTFFNIQGSVLNIEPLTPWKYIFFDHNTCVNIVQNFTTDIAAHLNTTITNNIFYNVGDYGSRIVDIQNGGGDTVQSGVIEVDTINTVNGQSVSAAMPENQRILKVKNNVYFWSQGVHDYWAANADSVARVPWMSSRELQMFSDKTTWPNFVAENNVEADPGFTKFGGTDQMVAQMYHDRQDSVFGFWGWYPFSGSDTLWALSHWPLPEDFTYSGSFTSTDGYHVGSLQWYPDELKSYQQNATAIRTVDQNQIPERFVLEQNYPNPFNPTTTIRYSVPKSSFVTIKVYDVLGNEVKTLVSERKAAGNHFVSFNAANLASGVYFYRMEAGNYFSTKKLILMK